MVLCLLTSIVLRYLYRRICKMLNITIPETQLYDEVSNSFIHIKQQTLTLEHSLVSLSKWESKWHKAFLTNKEKTIEEELDYIKCMTLTQNVKPETYLGITNENRKQISEYIDNPMSAIYFSQDRNRGRMGGEQITAELVYYWMIESGIPFECQKWHLNRLLTLIRVCNLKRQPPKKMSRSELISRNRALNEARRKQYNTKG